MKRSSQNWSVPSPTVAKTSLQDDLLFSRQKRMLRASSMKMRRERLRMHNSVMHNPRHPSEVLREDYLKPLGVSANALTIALKVPASRINDIVLERRGITVDTAMRIVRYFGGDVQSWMNLQTAYEIKVAEKLLAEKGFADIHSTSVR